MIAVCKSCKQPLAKVGADATVVIGGTVTMRDGDDETIWKCRKCGASLLMSDAFTLKLKELLEVLEPVALVVPIAFGTGRKR